MAGRTPSPASAWWRSRPASTTRAPLRSRSPSIGGGSGGRPNQRATSSTRGSNVLSTPGKTNASRPPSVASPRGANMSAPARSRNVLPAATIDRACSIRSGVGSRSARRQGPDPGAGSASASASTSSSGVDAASRSQAPSGAGLRARVRGRRTAWCCSRTTCALIPPKPKALTPARRGPADSHSAASRTSRNRVRSTPGCGSSQCRVGGRIP